MRRREFLGDSSTLLMGAPLICAASQTQTAPAGRELKEELSASETERVNNSAMARDLDNYFGKGFS